MIAQRRERDFHHVPKKRSNFKNLWMLNPFGLADGFFHSKKVLEIGATMFSPIHNLTEAAVNVGIDPLADYYVKGLPMSSLEVKGVGENLPFPDNYFHAIICLNVLDHTSNAETVLKQVNSCLEKTGYFLFAIETFNLPKLIRSILIQKIDPTHTYHFAPKELTKMLINAGFAIKLINTGHNLKSQFLPFHQEMRNRRYISALKVVTARLLFQNRYVHFVCVKVMSDLTSNLTN